MHPSDFSLAQRRAAASDANDSLRGVYLDARSAAARDRHVPSGAEHRCDLDHGAVHMDAVEEFSSAGNCNGRKYANDAQCDRELDEREAAADASFR
jgi:hypothetical protein